MFLCPCFSDYSRSVEISRSQGVRSTSNPAPSSYPCGCVWIALLERAFILAALFRGLLVRGSLFRVGG
ncbi:hypothetical protein A2U01_0084173 [Trifolium medium]|uniref:Uncharacterized protein n=1 Tax=Trifolium medium TaxID=97028 RepID=A0A392TS03_9FABA|nr:hypothetical protein [Trifolium medium]